MTLERVIKIFESAKSILKPGRVYWTIFDIALRALYAQLEAEKNEPLTMEEFLSMEGKPVWIVPAYEADWEPQWTIVHKDFLTVLPDIKNPKRMLMIFDYFYAYRHPPKEAQHDD